MKLSFLNIPIDNLTMAESIEVIEFFIMTSTLHVITFVNASKVVSIQKNELQRKALFESDLILADGLPIVWASHLLGAPLKERVAGCDLFEKLLQYGSQKKDWRFFLFGAKPMIVKKVKDNAEELYKEIQIVGFRDGYYSIKEEEQIAQMINDSGANILFLGFSSPQKEEFVVRNRDRLKNIRLIQGVGGSFDIFAGAIKRAPKWIQNFGLEWFYRGLQEPRRMWKRYLITNVAFILLVIREFLRVRVAGRIREK